MSTLQVITISVFDHCLSEKEAGSSKIITYNTAVKNNAVSAYLVGERRFLNVYKSIGDEAVCCFNSKHKKLMKAESKEFENYLISGLREKTFTKHYMRYIDNLIIVFGRWDRTDDILVNTKDKDLLKKVYNLIKLSGLYILDDSVIDSNQFHDIYHRTYLP